MGIKNKLKGIRQTEKRASGEEITDDHSKALSEVVTRLYDELRCLASSHLRKERAGHALDTRALVHEVYLRLSEQRRCEWKNQAHFFGTATHMMRRILIDHARQESAARRIPRNRQISTEEVILSSRPVPELVALHEAIDALSSDQPEQAEVIVLRYFGGLTSQEIAHSLKISIPTVTRRLRKARHWLLRFLRDPIGP